MEQEMVELTRKIDLLTAQVQYLTEQGRIAERQREERSELMRDLLPVVNDVYRLSVEQLEEVEEYVDMSDLLRLLKRLLRNGRNIEGMLDQLESMSDLLTTMVPMGDEAFGKAVSSLEQMERKGYFVFARGGMQIVDNIVTSFGEDDVRRLGENVVLILQTVKEMTQPEVMHLLRDTVQVIDRDKDLPVKTSLVALLRQMQNPDVRRGLAITLRALGALGTQVAASAGNDKNGR